MKNRLVASLLSVTTILGVPSTSLAGDCDDKQLQVLSALLPVTQESFGECLAFHENLMVVGAPGKATVYVFQKVGPGWQQVAKIAQVPVSSVATNGTQVFVGNEKGALSGFGNPGEVRVYEKVLGFWSVTQTLTPSDADDDDMFGFSLDVDEDLLIVGAPRINGQESFGTAYLFESQGGSWVESAILVPSDPKDDGHFGADVAMSGQAAVVGSPRASGASSSSGAAYVFELELGAWGQTSKLLTPATFGTGELVAVDEGVVAVAADREAYVFEKFGPFWTLTQELGLSFGDLAEIDALDIHGGRIARGHGTDGAVGSQAGAVVIYEQVDGVWVDRMKAVSEEPQSFGLLGTSVALFEDVLIAGAPEVHWTPASSAGAVVVFDAQPNPSPEYGVGCAGSNGKAPTLDLGLSYDGCVTVGSNLSFSVVEGLGGALAIVLLGLSPADVPLFDGCSLLIAPAGFSGALPLLPDGSLAFGATIPAYATPGTIFMQAFIAEPNLAQGFSATNGLRVTIEP